MADKDGNARDAQSVPSNWAQLLRKLRWSGLDDEAKRLEKAVSTLPPEERGTRAFGPFHTD